VYLPLDRKGGKNSIMKLERDWRLQRSAAAPQVAVRPSQFPPRQRIGGWVDLVSSSQITPTNDRTTDGAA